MSYNIYVERFKNFMRLHKTGALIGAAALLPVGLFALWQDTGLFRTVFFMPKLVAGTFGMLLNIAWGAVVGALVQLGWEKFQRSGV